MVQETHSVVTPERFAAGYTYAGYLDSIERNRARFEENYAAMTISGEDAAALRELASKPNGPAKLLVIGEDWCPDVFRGLPVFQRIAEAAGIELRVFKRDENKDVIAEFLNGGEFESIPVAVFYTKDHDYIAHWIERPQLAYQDMREKLAPMYARWRKPDPTDEERAQFRQEYIDFQNGPIWANWRQETVREVIALLREKVR